MNELRKKAVFSCLRNIYLYVITKLYKMIINNKHRVEIKCATLAK